MTVEIRRLAARDRDDWARLYAGYAAFYGVAQTEEMRARVFDWLLDGSHECEGLVAVRDSRIIGLTHFRPFVSPLRALTNCFLDDLFIEPQARGLGAADALIDAVTDIARDRGWGVVRWITAEDNYRGRAVYDRLAKRTAWITYDKAP